jgi:pimeloyl-ACP methyl ester carboxylesterase
MAKNDTSFWSSRTGHLLLFLAAVLAAAVAASVAFLHPVTHPPRDRSTIDPADLLLRTEDVAFQAADGVPLSGWLAAGRRSGSVIILCHDLGGSRLSLVNSAVSLSRAGFPLFLFDFRAHGRSGGRRSTLGIDERLDVLGAIDHLRGRPGAEGTRFGIWGIGMGAYAGALAALESERIVALALDGIYPDVPAQLDRLVGARVPPALRFLVPVIRLSYNPYFAFELDRRSVGGSLEALAGRNILFIAGTDSPERHAEEKALYAALPESPAADKNFLELKASVITGLYDEDKKKYDQEIVRFFSSYLAPEAGAGKAERRPIQVLER